MWLTQDDSQGIVLPGECRLPALILTFQISNLTHPHGTAKSSRELFIAHTRKANAAQWEHSEFGAQKHVSEAHSIFVFAQEVFFISQAQSKNLISFHPTLSKSILQNLEGGNSPPIFCVKLLRSVNFLRLQKRFSNEDPYGSSPLTQGSQITEAWECFLICQETQTPNAHSSV